MPVRPLNREQCWLLPPRLDELIPDDHPARFVATVVDALPEDTWQELGIGLNGDPLGAPAYHPRALLSVWLFGFMTGTRSSRKLEGACRDQVPYLWLTGWQHPDHNTLWRFYKEHRSKMRHLFTLTVKTALRLDLVDMAIQAIDGTKVAGNAAKDRIYDEKGLQRLLERTEKVIQEMEQANEAGNEPAPPHLPQKLQQVQNLRQEVQAALAYLGTVEGKKFVNLTDRDTNLMKAGTGLVAGYNVQAVVSPLKTTQGDQAGMLLTAVETVQDAADNNQLIPMIKQAAETTGQKAGITVADAGYSSGANLVECEERHQSIAMPQTTDLEADKPYYKDKFTFNPETNTYSCPCGHTLRDRGTGRVENTVYRYYRARSETCRACKAFGVCTRSVQGRTIAISPFEAQICRHRVWMMTLEARCAYHRRKELVEPVFGIIKEQLGLRRFLLRGWDNVSAEANLIATAFNLRVLWRVHRSRLAEDNRKMVAFFTPISLAISAPVCLMKNKGLLLRTGYFLLGFSY